MLCNVPMPPYLGEKQRREWCTIQPNLTKLTLRTPRPNAAGLTAFLLLFPLARRKGMYKNQV
jgi:hypothetical protein